MAEILRTREETNTGDIVHRETDAKAVILPDGSTLYQMMAFFLPVGVILPYGGNKAPTGFLIANGAAYSRKDYADLFAVYGTTYGAGDGSTTFNVPDLRNRFPLGYDANLGAKGGASTHQLIKGEMPEHYHDFVGQNGLDTATLWGMVGTHYPNRPGFNLGSTTHGTNPVVRIGTEGNNQPHNNIPPFLALAFIIKI